MYSTGLVTLLWRVILASISSQTDMPSLTTVTLHKRWAFYKRKTVNTESSSSFPPSFLDITPALQEYLQFIVSFTLSFIPTPNRRFHFALQFLLSFLIMTLSILTGISHVMLSSIPSSQFSHFIVIPEIKTNAS